MHPLKKTLVMVGIFFQSSTQIGPPNPGFSRPTCINLNDHFLPQILGWNLLPTVLRPRNVSLVRVWCFFFLDGSKIYPEKKKTVKIPRKKRNGWTLFTSPEFHQKLNGTEPQRTPFWKLQSSYEILRFFRGPFFRGSVRWRFLGLIPSRSVGLGVLWIGAYQTWDVIRDDPPWLRPSHFDIPDPEPFRLVKNPLESIRFWKHELVDKKHARDWSVPKAIHMHNRVFTGILYWKWGLEQDTSIKFWTIWASIDTYIKFLGGYTCWYLSLGLQSPGQGWTKKAALQDATSTNESKPQ